MTDCPHPKKTGRRTVATNGASMVAAYCTTCWTRTSNWISHELMRSRGIDPHAVPLLHDYSAEKTCERCGSTDGTEEHHYAPKHLFDDYDRWPTGYLCRPCHDQWHRTTRTGTYYHAEAL